MGELLTALLELLCIDSTPSGDVRIECNLCNVGDYLWLDGDAATFGWIAPAVAHITTHHASELPDA